MLRAKQEKQQANEFVSIEDLVPQDHLLRKADKFIDFSFIDVMVVVATPFYTNLPWVFFIYRTSYYNPSFIKTSCYIHALI
jgi:hypothetical protein